MTRQGVRDLDFGKKKLVPAPEQGEVAGEDKALQAAAADPTTSSADDAADATATPGNKSDEDPARH